MTRAVRPFFAILLALMLVSTGIVMSAIRGAAAATGQMEICIGDTVQTVFTDADGQPTSAPHICPDCLLAWSQDTSCTATFQKTDWVINQRVVPVSSGAFDSAETLCFEARGPPIVS